MGSIIRLPSTIIVLQSILIRYPIKIKGQPGCILQFNNTNITIDFNEYPFHSTHEIDFNQKQTNSEEQLKVHNNSS